MNSQIDHIVKSVRQILEIIPLSITLLAGNNTGRLFYLQRDYLREANNKKDSGK